MVVTKFLQFASYCVLVYIGWLAFDYGITNWKQKRGGKKC
jgi:threonine/homoserine/homoserine lactone efflux protein